MTYLPDILIILAIWLLGSFGLAGFVNMIIERRK